MIVNSKADYELSRTEIFKKKRYAENMSKTNVDFFFFFQL